MSRMLSLNLLRATFYLAAVSFLLGCATALHSELSNDGSLRYERHHPLNARNAINPVSVSEEHARIGETSIRFESNPGECGYEPGWSDCANDRERAELYYANERWKSERWYRFHIYVPEEFPIIYPAKVSLIQWKRRDPSKVLVMFQYMDEGLVFNRNGDTFRDSYVLLKNDQALRGQWTDIVFSTNWDPNPETGYMRVWIDGALKFDFAGRSNTESASGRLLNLRYGIYNSFLTRHYNFANKKPGNRPAQVLYFDGVRGGDSCVDLGFSENECRGLNHQEIKTVLRYRYNKTSPGIVNEVSNEYFNKVAQ